ncbi:MAG: HAMP domain-containing histidine kinase [Ignavibacteria bacterium]|nr:HAMP domain-containing histidine kinase [Ignavibacteria bacterium]
MLNRLSLRTKLVFLLCGFIASISFGLTLLLPAKLEDEALITVANLSKTMTEMTSNNISSGVLFADTLAIKDELLTIKKSTSIEFIVVRDTTGVILGSIDYDQVKGTEFDGRKDTTGITSEGSIYCVVQPIKHDGIIIGKLTLGVSIQTIRDQLDSTKRTFLLIVIVLFVIGAILIYFFSRFITNSLRSVVESAEIITSGDLSHRASVLSHDEIGHLAASFNTMVDNLQKALIKERDMRLLKTRFVNTISHEFRTPLTGIGISADILEHYDEILTLEQKKSEINKIKQRVSELTDLMDDFLLHSTVESLREFFTVTPINVRLILEHSIDDIRRIAQEEEITINSNFAEESYIIQGDANILHYVCSSIISNAVKFSRKGGEIYISINYSSNRDTISIVIQDFGIGIPESDIDFIFTQFYRGSNTAEIPGTGIGLSISKEFIELHNGRITAQSTPTQGTIFTIELPVVYKKF